MIIFNYTFSASLEMEEVSSIRVLTKFKYTNYIIPTLIYILDEVFKNILYVIISFKIYFNMTLKYIPAMTNVVEKQNDIIGLS